MSLFGCKGSSQAFSLPLVDTEVQGSPATTVLQCGNWAAEVTA